MDFTSTLKILLFLETFHHPFKCSFSFHLPPVTMHCDKFSPACLFLKTLISGPDHVCVCMWGVAGMCIPIYLFLSHFAPGVVQCIWLMAWGKTEHTSYKNVFLKCYLKWHRTQGLTSNFSKPGVNATAETCCSRDVEEGGSTWLLPTETLGEEMSPGNSSEVPHYSSFTLQVRVGTGALCPAAARRSVLMRSALWTALLI